MQQERICCPGLPLAVYREVAAHLRQVSGVEVESIARVPTEFDYHQSQVDSLVLRYPDAEGQRDRIDAILGYYAQRHSPWQRRIMDNG
ncbi:hypothetical protein [Oscillatoria sp. FACHB-1406]|uniref:hypothetical protein n=1 Tax=Oscillatoria sp. FACHB-1406 TaxID=2692846 RepID=UPI0016869940|nr:hypothetical protein [Oscillatoria sp. FACHB-1406]MBD2576417.1 hypothetical protein [Oscillatoria sp. FACHB-1406]